jgi:hypothetical protein
MGQQAATAINQTETAASQNSEDLSEKGQEDAQELLGL